MKKFVLISITFLSISAYSYSNNIYPSSFKIFEKYDGGELLISSGNEISQPRFYFIKHDWLNVSTYVTSWVRLERNYSKGNIFPDSDFLSSKTVGDNLYNVIWRDRKLQFAIIDTNIEIKLISDIPIYDQYIKPMEIEWVINDISDNCLLLIDGNLYYLKINSNSLDITFISESVFHSSLRHSEKLEDIEILYILNKSTSSNIILSDAKGTSRVIARIPIFDYNKCQFLNDTIVATISSNSGYNSLINIINIEKGILSSFWLESEYDKINFVRNDGNLQIYCLRNIENVYHFQVIKLDNFSIVGIEFDNPLSFEFVAPRAIYHYNSIFYVLFFNGIISIDETGQIQSADKIPIIDIFKDIPSIQTHNNIIVLSSKIGSVIFKSSPNYLWRVNRFISTSGKYIIPIILVILILALVQSIRHQKRLLLELIELPANGSIIVINKSGKLFKINDYARNIFGIDKSVKLGRAYENYIIKTELLPIKEQIDIAYTNKETLIKRINLLINGESKEWLCTIVPLRNIAGQFRGLIFTGIDITEQLERRRLFNWAQLLHDMQTNLSTIKLNAEQIEPYNPQDIIRLNKISHQVNILINRVRDIVTVGRTDYADLMTINADEICKSALSEFDENMSPNIKFLIKSEKFTLKCDKPKLIRAIRNAIENSIKSLKDKENGIIEIFCYKDAKNSYFTIKDNGCGMSQETVKKMLQPYFTTSKEKGGTGIGTMIMQQVIELHAGKIVINSEKDIGTELTFVIPLLQKTN